MDTKKLAQLPEFGAMLDINSKVEEVRECLLKDDTLSWILEELYTCSVNEMKDKFGLNEAYLLSTAVGLIDDKPSRTEFKKILTRAVLNASYYNVAGNVYNVNIEDIVDRLNNLKESQAITLIGMIQEVATQENTEIITEKVKRTFFSFEW